MNDDNEMTGDGKGARPGMLPLVVVAVVIVSAIGGIWAYNVYLKPDPALVTATISVDYGNGTVISEEISCDNNTALGLLHTLVGPENVDASELGFINSICGVANGATVPGLNDTSLMWWMMYVNGTLGSESAATLEVYDGSVVEFRFMIPEW